MTVVRRALVSEPEFLALPESVDKVELIDGEVIVSPSPTYWHQEILARIVQALRAWNATVDEPVTVGMSPLDVRFGPDRILQPDAFVLLAHVSADHDGPIDRVPELCIEVVSKDRIYDRVTKRYLYAAAGVREYWIVELSGAVERRSGEVLTDAEVVSDRLTSPLLAGFELDLSELFAR